MKKISIILSLFLIIISCQDQPKDQNPIAKFQQKLVDQGITGSNVTQVFKDGKVIYSNIVNSRALGDKDINDNTLLHRHAEHMHKHTQTEMHTPPCPSRQIAW